MDNELKFKLNSELKYLEDDMFEDLKKREARRNPITESFKELIDSLDDIEIGGNGVLINKRKMFMESDSDESDKETSNAENEADEDVMKQGTEKLMDMPMNEMKEFISTDTDEKETDTDDEEKAEDSEDSNDSDDGGATSDSGEDDKTVDNSVSDSTDSTDTEDDIDSDERLKSFGQDNSDIQNEYNTKDVDILNKLIASESEAINDYFDGAKDCNNETLRRLYGDIGHEERFHLEQLLYAKSTLTGERYEPRDPDVKREYEELVNMGMDEETAASTAIDKTSINSTSDKDVDLKELAQEAAMMETLLHQNAILTEFCCDMLQNTLKRNASMTRSTMILMEAFFQEEVVNIKETPNNVKNSLNPFQILAKGIHAFIEALKRLSKNVRYASQKTRTLIRMNIDWLSKNGLPAIFKPGTKLYFYDDANSRYDLGNPYRYVHLLCQLSTSIGKQAGIDVNSILSKCDAKTIKVSKPISFKSVEDGVGTLKQTVLKPTKVIVTDKNKDLLLREFFGYNSNKITSRTVKYDDSDVAVNQSDNIYHRLEEFLEVTKNCGLVAEGVLSEMKNLEKNPNSIYYKKRELYNDLIRHIKTVIQYFTKFGACISHDLNIILTYNDGLLELTHQREVAEKSGKKWEGDNITTSGTTSM